MIETIPKPLHGSSEWLLTRWRDGKGRCVFGASDIPPLMNASPYKSRGELFADKWNEPVKQKETAVFARGNLLESALLNHASKVLNTDLITPDVIYRDGRLSVSLDGVDVEHYPSLVVECKTTTRYRITDASDLPDEWLWQGYGQQAVLDCPVWFSVLDRDMRLSVVELPTNANAIDVLRTETEVFGSWIDRQVPIDDDINNFSAYDIARIWQTTPTTIELPQDCIEWVTALDDARTMTKDATALETTAKDMLARMLLGNEIGTVNGIKIVSWKQTQGRNSLDTASLREDHPELVAQYEKQGLPFRTMRTHKPKNKGENNE